MTMIERPISDVARQAGLSPAAAPFVQNQGHGRQNCRRRTPAKAHGSAPATFTGLTSSGSCSKTVTGARGWAQTIGPRRPNPHRLRHPRDH